MNLLLFLVLELIFDNIVGKLSNSFLLSVFIISCIILRDIVLESIGVFKWLIVGAHLVRMLKWLGRILHICLNIFSALFSWILKFRLYIALIHHFPLAILAWFWLLLIVVIRGEDRLNVGLWVDGIHPIALHSTHCLMTILTWYVWIHHRWLNLCKMVLLHLIDYRVVTWMVFTLLL